MLLPWPSENSRSTHIAGGMCDLLKTSSIPNKHVPHPHLIPHISRLITPPNQSQTKRWQPLIYAVRLFYAKNHTNFVFLTHNVISISNWVPSNLHQPCHHRLAWPCLLCLPVGRLFAHIAAAFTHISARYTWWIDRGGRRCCADSFHRLPRARRELCLAVCRTQCVGISLTELINCHCERTNEHC